MHAINHETVYLACPSIGHNLTRIRGYGFFLTVLSICFVVGGKRFQCLGTASSAKTRVAELSV